MKVEIEAVDSGVAGMLIEASLGPGAQLSALATTMAASTEQWIGNIDGEFACSWGVVPPTVLSDQAYLWMHVTDRIIGNEFIFIRHSQRQMEKLLALYPTIVGYADPMTPNTIRWLTLLGARFGQPQGKYIPFTIRRKDG